jgi:hypothetical protein
MSTSKQRPSKPRKFESLAGRGLCETDSHYGKIVDCRLDLYEENPKVLLAAAAWLKKAAAWLADREH